MYNHTDSWKLLGSLCTKYKSSIYPVYDFGKTIFEGLLYHMRYVYVSTMSSFIVPHAPSVCPFQIQQKCHYWWMEPLTSAVEGRTLILNWWDFLCLDRYAYKWAGCCVYMVPRPFPLFNLVKYSTAHIPAINDWRQERRLLTCTLAFISNPHYTDTS